MTFSIAMKHTSGLFPEMCALQRDPWALPGRWDRKSLQSHEESE